MQRILVVHEDTDTALAGDLAERLGTRFTVDVLCATGSIVGSASWLLTEFAGRVRSADAVVCLIGAASAQSAWTTWTIDTALRDGRRVVCARVHHSVLYDVPPPVVTARRLPIVNANADVIASFLERGEVPQEEVATPLLARLSRKT